MTNDTPRRMPNNIPPFVKFCCANVPAVFDDSLSYYEALCALWKYLQDCIDVINNNALLEEEFIEKFNELDEYVKSYFDNLDVQEEINNKLDQMAEDGSLEALLSDQLDGIRNEFQTEINQFEDQTNTAIANISARVDASVSGAPIPVGNVSDMLDTSKIYLLTTDGYWYYWNGSAWTRGNVYEATTIADGSVTPEKTTFTKRTINLIDIRDPHVVNGYIDPGPAKITENANTRLLYIACQPNTSYIVTRSIGSGRFGVATSVDTPANNVSLSQINMQNTATSISITTNSTANYLVVYYWHGSYAANTADEALHDLCIIEGTISQGVIPSYVVSVDTINYADESVTPEKTSFAKQSSNLFDYLNTKVVNIFPNPNEGDINGSAAVRSIYIPCDPNSNYVVHRRAGKRFSCYTTAAVPAVNASYIDYKADNTASEIKISTSATAHYLCVFFYNANQDTLTPQQIMESMVIVKGTESVESYIPYGDIIEVYTDNIDNGAVTYEKLADSIKGKFRPTGKFESRNGIFGVQYDITSSSSACTRIADATELHNDYIVDTTYQLHGGINDFDSIFPWCEIKRCNVRISSNGNKSITYEGEADFALDGTNGDVMVEIPKFYSMRKREGNTETLAITGEPKSGFNVEPAFVVDGKEVDYIYVGCYPTAQYSGTSYSYSGAFPDAYHTLSEVITTLSSNNLQSYDFATFMAIQKLMIIEFADRGITQYLGGMVRLPYLAPGTSNVIDGFGTNYITFQENVGQGILKDLWVGERIKIGDEEHENSLDNVRVITNIEKIGSQYTVTYDGDDLSSDISVGTGVGCIGQRSGLTDSLTYHTGRVSKSSGSDINKYVSPMRYRYIENIIGNVWDMLAGLKVKNLKAYYSTIPNFNAGTLDSNWKTLSYDLPLQTEYPGSNKAWILSEGYDFNDPLINLPLSAGSGGGANKYYGGTFYSADDIDTEYTAVCEGGWDTYYWANPNTIRINLTNTFKSQLYGSRPIYRG